MQFLFNSPLRFGFVVAVISLLLQASPLSAQTLTGTYTLPTIINGYHIDNLTTLAALLRKPANPVSGNVVFEFGPTYNEAAEVYPVVFDTMYGTGSIIVRPSSTTTGLLTEGLSNSTRGIVALMDSFDFTIDGRPGGTGTNIGWTFRNLSITQPTFYFQSAQLCTLQYVRVESQNSSTTSGTIHIGPNSHYLTIQHNLITDHAAGVTKPLNGIYTYDFALNSSNSNISILNNDISNFTATATASASGISITYFGTPPNKLFTRWLIKGNSFYRSGTEPGAGGYKVIRLVSQAPVYGNIIADNYIGGSAPLANGSFTTIAAGEGAVTGIFLNGAYRTLVSGNTINNIELTSTANTSFYGIHTTQATGFGDTILNNTIASIQNAGQLGVMGVFAINSALVDGNTIHDLVSTSTNVAAKSIGIYCPYGKNTVSNNTVFNLSSAAGVGTSTNVNMDAAVVGILVSSTTQSAQQKISNNAVYNISSTRATNTPVKVYGIAAYGGNVNINFPHILNGNMVYNIYGNAANNSTLLAGIYVNGHDIRVTNNIVRLGYRNDGSTVIEASLIAGMVDSSSNYGKRYWWHNSIYLGGTGITGSGNTHALMELAGGYMNIHSVQNNVLVNNRSNSTGTGKHYSFYLPTTVSFFSDHNVFHGTGNGFVAVRKFNTDYSTLAAWITFGTDSNSLDSNPQFVNPDGLVPDLHIGYIPWVSPVDQAGKNIPDVVYDKDSVLRGTESPTDIGAYVVCDSRALPKLDLTATALNICAGDQVTFTATLAAGAIAANYEFFYNGLSVQNGTSNTYTSGNWAQNDSVWAIVTVTNPCLSPLPVKSNVLIITVNAWVTPTVALAITPGHICPGRSVVFTATQTHGSYMSMFNFFHDGVSVQNGYSNTYTPSLLNNNDSVWVVLTSDAYCATAIMDTSPTIVVAIGPIVAPAINQTICFWDNYLGYDTTGIYLDTFSTATGCDSIRTLNLTVRPQNITTITQSICQGQSFEGYNTAGTYIDTMADISGCDSIRTLNLTITTAIQSSIIDTICFGDSYLGYGSTGVYIDTFQAVGGCDSIRSLNLTVRPLSVEVVNGFICQGLSFEGYTTMGHYIDTFTNVHGCDSVRTLHLLVVPIQATLDTAICSGNAYEGYNVAGTYVDTFVTPDGCDSTRILNLTISNTVTTSENKTICHGDTYQGHTVAGIYMDTLLSGSGCDSIHTLNLTVLTPNSTSESQTICDGENYQGHTSSGVYIDTLTGFDGCDSIHTLTLTVEPLPIVPAISAANNVLSMADTFASYQWYQDGSLLVGEEADTFAATANGNYTVVVTNAAGCADSAAAFNVTGISVDEVISAFGVMVYPNPTKGLFHITIEGILHSQFTVEVYNTLGERIWSLFLVGSDNSLDLSQYAGGIYWVKISNGSEVFTARVVKQ